MLAWLGHLSGPQSEALTAAEVEALAQGDQARWERHSRLAAWFLWQLPSRIALGVNLGISASFDEKAQLPGPYSFADLMRTMPDYRQPEDENG